MGLSPDILRPVVAAALAEDIGGGDVTTAACIPDDARARAYLHAKEPCVVCGLDVVAETFRQLDSRLVVNLLAADGDRVEPRQRVVTLEGKAQTILTGERVALNFIQRLSGIATMTRAFVDRVAGTRAQILDTRKTTPGLRALEKYAVTVGGGTNHRKGLYDQILVKDNHLVVLQRYHPEPVAAAVRAAKQNAPGIIAEVEVKNLDELQQALGAGADLILLDNMSDEEMAEAVRLAAGRAKLEASGGVTLDRAAAIARTGVDYISVGALTHSARAADFSLEIEE
jgi:nicotinate-nucleotide pyrophosphorylase (carboxylating)